MADDETYCCAQCGGVYTRTWTDEEAWAESAAMFPEEIANKVPFVIVCDDCWRTYNFPVTSLAHD